jgi:photosynthetic reaction center H subunit
METGAITSHIDVAQVVLYAFWVFFALLLIYLQRESRREGYPLVSEVDGKPENHGVIWVPSPKSFCWPTARP